MNIVLVGAEIEENLSIRYIVSSLRSRGHRAVVVPFNGPEDEEKAAECIMGAEPALVGLSMVFQRRAAEFMSLAGMLRRSGYGGHITCGGHFPTFAYEAILKDCRALDTVIRGEGELAMADLAEALEQGESLSGVAGLVRREVSGDGETIVANEPHIPVEDLDSLPFPARDTRPQLHVGVPMATIVGSRGCYGNCSFCCINAWHKASGGRKYRRRSYENLVREMAELYHNRGVRIFIFHDDNFFLPRLEDNLKKAETLGELFRREGMDSAGLVVKARPDNIDRQLFTLLKEIGLIRVYLGIENNSFRGLKSLNRLLTPGDNERALEILQDLDIFTCYNLLLFEPGTKPEDVMDNIRFMEKHMSVPHNFCRTECYTASSLYYRLSREGRLFGNYLVHDYEIEDPAIELLLRIFAIAFHERNFSGCELANANMSLGYHLHVLKRFYQGACGPDLAQRVDALTREINQTGIEYLQEALEFVTSKQPLIKERIKSFTVDLTARIVAANYRLRHEISQREREINEAALYGACRDAKSISGGGELKSDSLRRDLPVLKYATMVPAIAMLLSTTSCITQTVDPPPAPSVTNSLPPYPMPSVVDCLPPPSPSPSVKPTPSPTKSKPTAHPTIVDPLPSPPPPSRGPGPVDPLPAPQHSKGNKEGSVKIKSHMARLNVKSLPRTLGGEIRVIPGAGNDCGDIGLKMELFYQGAPVAGKAGVPAAVKDGEKLSPTCWRSPEGVEMRWSASSGELEVTDDGIALWKASAAGKRSYVCCECTAPDGALWIRSCLV